MKTENLTFLEAVKALQAGKCEGIKRKPYLVIFTTRENSNVLIEMESCNEFISYVTDVVATDWQLVNVKPEVETVQFEEWCIKDHTNNTLVRSSLPSKEAAEEIIKENNKEKEWFICKVTGSYTVPVKEKVKREVETQIRFLHEIEPFAEKTIGHLKIGSPIKLKLEWEE